MDEPELVLLDNFTKREICVVWQPGKNIDDVGPIEESKVYIFELRNIPNSYEAHLSVDDIPLKRDVLSTSRVRWEWSVGFYAGEVEISIQLEQPWGSINKLLVTDPDKRKLTRGEFDAMVQQILKDTFALLSLSSHKVQVARGNTTQFPSIARLEFLRSKVNQLETVIHAINNRPTRILRSVMESVPFHKATHITSIELNKSLTETELVQSEEMRKRLPEKLQGRIPRKIYQKRKTQGLNIREHRDMKHSLNEWSTWLSAMGSLLTKKGEERDTSENRKKWGLRCKDMSRRLKELLTLPLFEDVQDSREPILATSIYRRVPIYGQFLAIYSDFQLGISNIVGDFLQVGLARTFDLYEIWAFLRFARAASIMFSDTLFDPARLFEIDDKDSKTITVSSKSVCLNFGSQMNICFQRTYNEFWRESDGRGSFSREMRPDFAIEMTDQSNAPSALIVLDAKYRVDAALNDAISSIHMYRDALVSAEGENFGNIKRIVAGAYLVTPSVPSLNTKDENWQNLPLQARIFHPEYRGNFRFGAVTMRPGITDAEVVQLLKAIIDDCTK